MRKSGQTLIQFTQSGNSNFRTQMLIQIKWKNPAVFTVIPPLWPPENRKHKKCPTLIGLVFAKAIFSSVYMYNINV